MTEETKTGRSVSLADQAADRLVELILLNGSKPGDKLPNEYELAERLKISRSTVREAIRKLVSRNILDVRQGAGTFISYRMGVPEDPLGLTFIGSDVSLALDLSDVRLIIEPHAAELAALHATEEQIAYMLELCDQIKQRLDRSEPYIHIDMELHRRIGESCGNAILRNLMIILSDAAAISFEVTQGEYQDVAYVEHIKIVEAIQRRDAAGARYAMISHLTTIRLSLDKRRYESQPQA